MEPSEASETGARRNDTGEQRRQRVALTVAGFDPSSGAGVTADLAVFAAHGLFGVSAITGLTIQSTLGVADVQPIQADWLARTLDFLEADLPADGVKIGMLGSEGSVRAVAAFLRSKLAARPVPVVLDPVLRSSSGRELLEPSALAALRAELLPLAGWITPNWAELEALNGVSVRSLSGVAVRSLDDVRAAAARLGERYPGLTIVATGGDADPPVDLLRTPDGRFQSFEGERVETRSTHGTGCAFSSALLARLLLGANAAEAVAGAKAYVTEALRSAPGLGHGRGPLELFWPLRR